MEFNCLGHLVTIHQKKSLSKTPFLLVRRSLGNVAIVVEQESGLGHSDVHTGSENAHHGVSHLLRPCGHDGCNILLVIGRLEQTRLIVHIY